MSISLLFLYILFFHSYTSLPTPSSHPTTLTVPSFQEQSYVKGCPLSLSNELFNGIKDACSSSKHSKLQRSRCCPVLAAWLYSSYSSTALRNHSPSSSSSSSSSFDMPLVPDDSETCVDGLEKALKVRGIEIVNPNESCDLVYCSCGIRLHPFNCPDSFSVTKSGELVGDESVRKLEKSCLSSDKHVNGFQGLEGCSKCLNSLYLLNKKTSNSSKEDRTTKIHNKDCELMGLTWLLSKNRTAYIHTVTDVLRALLLNNDGSKPQSCTLNSDGMPLAVDSSEIINEQSSSTTLQLPMSLSLLLVLCLVQCVQVFVLFS
ncbi:hypothetical protein KIW84_010835 [Lathyrus oleraceus]|uniref:SPARK domain-containing protein n=2 Tax=Pisum sativum TaxID=3888 RepID=A0A9D4YNV0_PEA|nr:hypothetical protein KIW84_010835 [Pisum sativum]